MPLMTAQCSNLARSLCTASRHCRESTAPPSSIFDDYHQQQTCWGCIPLLLTWIFWVTSISWIWPQQIKAVAVLPFTFKLFMTQEHILVWWPVMKCQVEVLEWFIWTPLGWSRAHPSWGTELHSHHGTHIQELIHISERYVNKSLLQSHRFKKVPAWNRTIQNPNCSSLNAKHICYRFYFKFLTRYSFLLQNLLTSV